MIYKDSAIYVFYGKNAWKVLYIKKVCVILHRNFDCGKIFNNNIIKKEGENIEKALKKFKRKFEKTGVVKELRSRQQFDKPSVLKRLKMERAIYVQKLHQVEE